MAHLPHRILSPLTIPLLDHRFLGDTTIISLVLGIHLLVYKYEKINEWWYYKFSQPRPLPLSRRGVKSNHMSLILSLSIITQPELFLKFGQAIRVLFISLQGQLKVLKKSPYAVKNNIKICLKSKPRDLHWRIKYLAHIHWTMYYCTMIPRFQRNWYIILERHVCRDLRIPIFDKKVPRWD